MAGKSLDCSLQLSLSPPPSLVSPKLPSTPFPLRPGCRPLKFPMSFSVSSPTLPPLQGSLGSPPVYTIQLEAQASPSAPQLSPAVKGLHLLAQPPLGGSERPHRDRLRPTQVGISTGSLLPVPAKASTSPFSFQLFLRLLAIAAALAKRGLP